MHLSSATKPQRDDFPSAGINVSMIAAIQPKVPRGLGSGSLGTDHHRSAPHPGKARVRVSSNGSTPELWGRRYQTCGGLFGLQTEAD